MDLVQGNVEIVLNCSTPERSLEIPREKIQKDLIKKNESRFDKLVAKKNLKHHIGYVASVAVSPSGDFIVSGSLDKTIIIWDAKTGEKVRVLEGHTNSVMSVAVSPSGDCIVSGSEDKTIIIWDTKTGEKIRLLEGHCDEVRSLAVSPSSDFIVSGSYDKTIIIWDAKTGEKIRVLEGHKGLVRSVAVSPSGDFIVSGSKIIIIWDAKTGEKVRLLEGHKGLVNSVAISPSGDFIVSGSEDKTIIIWDAKTGEKVRLLEGHKSSVKLVAVSPSGDFIVGSDDKTIIVWDAKTGERTKILEGHESLVSSVAVSPSGDFIVSGSYDKTIIIWDAKTGEKIKFLEGHKRSVNSIAVSPSGDFIVSGSRDKTILIWDAKTGEKMGDLEGHKGFDVKGNSSDVNSVAVSPSGDFIVSGSRDKTIIIWDAKTGEKLRLLEGHKHEVFSVVVSPSGDYIVSGSEDKTIIIWDAKTGEKIRVLEGHKREVNSVAVSPSGDFIVSGSDDKTIVIWNAKTGEKVRVLEGHTNRVRSVAVSPSGDFIVSGSEDKTIIIWNAKSGEKIRVLEGHSRKVNSVAVSPSGDFIVSGSDDKTIIIWNAKSGEKIRTFGDEIDSLFISFQSYVLFSCFSLDGNSIYYASGNAVVQHCLFENNLLQDACSLNTNEDRPDLILSLVKELKLLPSNPLAIIKGAGWSTFRPAESGLVLGALSIDQNVLCFNTCVTPLKAEFIPVQGIAGLNSKFLPLIFKHASKINQLEVFDNEVVKYLIQFKWETYVKQWFLFDFHLTCVLASLFLIHSVVYNMYSSSESDAVFGLGCLLLSVTFLLGVYFLYHELCQMYSVICRTKIDEKDVLLTKCKKIFLTFFFEYFLDIWNQLQLLTCVMLLTTLSLQSAALASSNHDSYSAAILSVIVMPFLACQILFYLGGLQSTGPLIRMIIKILHGIKGVIFILIIMVVFFAGSFTVLFQSDYDSGYSGYDNSLLAVYGFLYGNYEISDFETSSSPALAKLLVSLFMFFVNLLILNLLIALMGDIFDSVQAKASQEATYGIAKLVLEYEALFSEEYKKKNEEKFYPLWLHVIRKDDKEDESGDLAATFKREIANNNAKIDELQKLILELQASMRK